MHQRNLVNYFLYTCLLYFRTSGCATLFSRGGVSNWSGCYIAMLLLKRGSFTDKRTWYPWGWGLVKLEYAQFCSMAPQAKLMTNHIWHAAVPVAILLMDTCTAIDYRKKPDTMHHCVFSIMNNYQLLWIIHHSKTVFVNINLCFNYSPLPYNCTK